MGSILAQSEHKSHTANGGTTNSSEVYCKSLKEGQRWPIHYNEFMVYQELCVNNTVIL